MGLGKLGRAHWSGMNTALQNAYEKAEGDGDQKAMDAAHQKIEAHHEKGSAVDKTIRFADDLRELPAAIREARSL